MKNWERYKRLRKCRENFLKRCRNEKCIQIMNKICRRYFYHGVLFMQNDVVVVFGGRYMRDFKTRVNDWISYFKKLIEYNQKTKVRKKWGKLIKPTRPVHLKISDTPNEAFMEEFLMSAGFEVKDEILEFTRSIYIIGPEYPDF